MIVFHKKYEGTTKLLICNVLIASGNDRNLPFERYRGLSNGKIEKSRRWIQLAGKCDFLKGGMVRLRWRDEPLVIQGAWEVHRRTECRLIFVQIAPYGNLNRSALGNEGIPHAIARFDTQVRAADA